MSNNAGLTNTVISQFAKTNPSRTDMRNAFLTIAWICGASFISGVTSAQNLEMPQKKSVEVENLKRELESKPITSPEKKVSVRKVPKRKAPTEAPMPAEPLPQTKSVTAEDSGAPAQYQFKVEVPLKESDSRPQFQFNDGILDKAQIAPPKYKQDELPDSEVFALYPGYPKNQISVGIRPYSVSSKWNYQGQDFSFPTTSVGYGIGYRFLPNPNVLVEAEYAAYGIETTSATVDPFLIQSSSITMDSLFLKGAYCFFGSSSFFRQLCPGIDVGYDTYPVLDFASSSTLKLSQVRDIIFGLNLAYQIPLTDQTRLRLKVGYNKGTGAGNSGTLTSKENTSYYLLGELNWSFNDHHSMVVGGEYRARDANLSGKRGVNTDTWKTTSVILGLQLSYVYTF
ncbi:MAG: outer membrane beta-barrel protein [Bdellovibrionales bacterium]|nr:outer membrane beta-barrel protein [Bdellovibrionales bacterium]